jgi:transcriptional regulator
VSRGWFNGLVDTLGGAVAYSYQKSMGRPQKPGVETIGTLDLLILSRLARGSMHGFGIAEYLHQVSDALHVEEGSLYPALHRLESQGLIESEWGVSENKRRARFYRLTPRGRKQISVEVSNWRRMVAAVNRVIDPLVP